LINSISFSIKTVAGGGNNKRGEIPSSLHFAQSIKVGRK